MDAIGLLTSFKGVSVQNGWAASFRYGCEHALCLVPIVCELTELAEEMGLWWAQKLKRVLLRMKQGTDEARSQGKQGL